MLARGRGKEGWFIGIGEEREWVGRTSGSRRSEKRRVAERNFKNDTNKDKAPSQFQQAHQIDSPSFLKPSLHKIIILLIFINP